METQEFKYLPTIKDPLDLRNLTVDELDRLAEEIRKRIIQTIARIGGHFGASMGVVELTLALHYALETPKDKLVWDVGHQGYVHKLITGRNERFDTIRQTGGLSGFLRRDESEYDPIGAGHASTSISAALGLAKARDIRGEDYKVCAIIGDGSMSGGLAYEALNNAGYQNTGMMVVLNDNEMSISQPVGAISRYTNRIITDHFYNQTKEDIEYMISRIPLVGERLAEWTHKMEKTAKGLILPGRFFENLGFRDIGPIDGHDVGLLIDTINRVKGFNEPILLHVITRKGKGYEQSEKDPSRWHAPGLFEPATGKKIIKKTQAPPSYTQVAGREIQRQARRRKDVAAITAAMTVGVGLEEFADEFPERFFDVGIAEGHAVTFAAGLAAEGVLPFVCIYSTFLQRAYDNIIHDVTLQKLKVIFCVDRGGLVGEDGPTHHGVLDLSFLRTIPGLTIMAPRNEAELSAMIHTAAEKCEGAVAIRYPRGAAMGVEIPAEPETLEIGKSQILRDGRDITLLAIGRMANVTEEAAEILAKTEGVDARVIDMRFLKPLDEEVILRAAQETDRLFSVEENTVVGGFGAAINEFLSSMKLSERSCSMIGLKDGFVPHGKMEDLFKMTNLTPEGVARQISDRLRAERPASISIPAK